MSGIWQIISFGAVDFVALGSSVILTRDDNPLAQPSVEADVVARGSLHAPAMGAAKQKERILVATILGDDAALDAVTSALDTLGGAAQLTGRDEAGNDWYVTARLLQHIKRGGHHKATFLAADGTWRSTATRQYSATQTGDTLTITATVGGNRAAAPIIRLTPRNAKIGGFGYARWVGLYSRVDAAMVNYPIEATGGGLNTAALVSAGKMQADGDDIWLYVDGTPASRWLAGMNTSATKIWTTINFSARAEGKLKTAIGASGSISTIALVVDTVNLATLNRLAGAANKLVMIDGEVFSFTGVDMKNYYITGVQRAQRWTSAAAHAAGAVVRWIEHDVYLMYGNNAIDAPEDDASKTPMFDLSASSNATWAYSAYYDSAHPDRPGAWKPTIVSSTGKQSVVYTATHGGSADPASAMGMRSLAYMLNGVWKAETAQIEWKIVNPACFTAVSASGEKYKFAASFGTKAGLQKGVTAFADVWNEAAPTAVQTWQTFTRNGVSLSGSFPMLRFFFYSSLAALANNEAALEIYNVTLTLDSSKTPVVTLGAEQNNYWMETSVTCAETGETIRLRGICPLDATVELNCEAKAATLNGENAMAMVALDSYRERWMGLPAGTAHVTIADAGATSVEVELEFEERTV